MKPLASAPYAMPRSGIRVIMDLALMIPDAIHLEIGQPNFPTPKHISEAAFLATQQGFTGYAPNAGLLSLRSAILEKVRRENAIQAEVDNVIVTTGGMGGLFSTLTALLEAGDEILLPDPGYPNFEMIANLCHATAVKYPLDPAQGFQPRLESLPGLVSRRTKAILINSPSNPAGAVFTLKTFETLLTFARQNDLYLVSDECYEKIVFEVPHISPASLDSDRVISIFSFSKTYAMTGWRVGYVVAPTEIATTVLKLQEATVACTSTISQKAAEAAISGPQDCVKTMVAAYRRRRDQALAILKKYQINTYVPQGAFYLLVDISRRSDDFSQFAQDFLVEEKVAVAPGQTFGELGDKYVRVSLAAEDEALVTGLERLCSVIAG